MVGRNIREHHEAKGHDVCFFPSNELNLLDFEATHTMLADLRPDIVIHAAGVVGGIQENHSHPVVFLTANTQMGFNVILAAQRARVPYLLNLGSSCMYPRQAANPLKEESILTGSLEPTNEGYALAKLACMRLCEYISQENPFFTYLTLIPCNLYGRYDNFDLTTGHMVPAVIRKLLEAKQSAAKSVEIWGDGKTRREFMYAEDLADFVFFALEQLDNLPLCMNVGLGRDYSIKEYYEIIAQVVGYEGQFLYDTSKPTGMPRKLVDINKQRALGWSPSFSLEEGISKTLAYYEGLIS